MINNRDFIARIVQSALRLQNSLMRWLITLALNLNRCAVQNRGLGKSRGLAGYRSPLLLSWRLCIKASLVGRYILFEQVY